MKIRSLQRRMYLALILPLCAILALSSVIALYLAMHFARVVHDRWLDDSVNSLAQAVVRDPTGARLELTEPAGRIFRWDAEDQTWYRLESPRGTLAGSADLPLLAANYDYVGNSQLYDSAIGGLSVRVARLDLPAALHGEPLTLLVAETIHKRTRTAREIALAVLAPQALLAVLAALLLASAVRRTIHPLELLAAQLNAQSHDRLDPLPMNNIPEEVQPLVAALNELLARLANVMRSKQHFLATAAHDLRTPLAAALLHLERVQGADDASRASLTTAMAAMRRASRATQQVLSLAHAELTAVDRTTFGVVDLCELAHQIGAELAPVAARKGQSLSLEVSQKQIRAKGNHDLLAIAVSNLLDNAIQYTSLGGSISVSVFLDEPLAEASGGLATRRAAVRIANIDASSGFAATSAVATDVKASQNGAGLGLAIAREVAARHGGRLEFALGAVGSATLATLWLESSEPQS